MACLVPPQNPKHVLLLCTGVTEAHGRTRLSRYLIRLKACENIVWRRSESMMLGRISFGNKAEEPGLTLGGFLVTMPLFDFLGFVVYLF